MVVVEDSGSGLDASIIARIFDSMFTTKPQGMALSLSICRSIVEGHGGRLWASTMALAFQLQTADYTPTELSTEAAVSLEAEGAGFGITRSALTLRAKVPNLDEATFNRLARDAELNCPVSKVLKAEVTLDAKLV